MVITAEDTSYGYYSIVRGQGTYSQHLLVSDSVDESKSQSVKYDLSMVSWLFGNITKSSLGASVWQPTDGFGTMDESLISNSIWMSLSAANEIG